MSSRSGRVAVPPKLYPVIALDYLPFHIEKMVAPLLSFDVEGLDGLVRRSRGQFNGPDLLKKYKLTRDCLEAGVRCLECHQQKMEWSRLRWRCSKCGFVSADAHEFALQEYAVLFGNEITTEFTYTWLGIEDKYVLYRMLENSTIKINNRGRRLIIEKNKLLIAYFETIYS